MKIQPVNGPQAVASNMSINTGAQDAAIKARAVAAFNKQAQSSQSFTTGQEVTTQQVYGKESAKFTSPSNHSAQLNQNAIAPEDLSAISAQTPQQSPQPGQQDVVEATQSQPETKPEAKDPALSRQFAQLARQERALRAKVQAQEQAIKSREAELIAREEAIKARDSQFSPDRYISRDELKQNTLGVLSEAGISTEEFLQQALNQTPRDPRIEAEFKRLQEEIKNLKTANEDARKSQESNQQAAYQAAVKQIKTDATNLVKQDPAFETVKATNSVQDVVDLITQTYDKDGVLLSVEEAAKEVEDYLVEEAMKLTRIGKIKKQLQQNQQVAPSSSVQKSQATNRQQPPMKTLTNATSSTRPLSARERALLAFEGKLKS